MLASPSRSPVSITFTIASCLKNTVSVCTSTLKNKPEIVVLLSFILFDFHERPHFTHLGCIHTHKTTEQLVKTPHNHHRIRDNFQMTCIKRSVLVVISGVVIKLSYNPDGGDELKLPRSSCREMDCDLPYHELLICLHH